MYSTKKIIQRIKQGDSFIEVYPRTTADNIIYEENELLIDYIKKLENRIEELETRLSNMDKLVVDLVTWEDI